MTARFSWDFPYPSRRMPVLAGNVVATSQPLAAQAGVDALRRGGNAVDAAIATAIALTVVEPTMNGIGGDAFAIIWDGRRLHGLNASGCSPRAWTPERFSGREVMPDSGWDSVTVPGGVSAWVELSRRFGKLPFGALFPEAVRYAKEGFSVPPITAAAWARAHERFRDYPDFQRAFCPEGRAPLPGEVFRFPEQEETLLLIAETSGEAFYRGALAERIAAASRAGGGALTEEDLAAHEPFWVDPVSVGYRGYTLHEIPPNGQGIAALMALGMLAGEDMAGLPVDSADSLHRQVEGTKLALADARRHVTDPRMAEADADALLDPDYLARRASSIRMESAGDPHPGRPAGGDTVYLCTADDSGMMVSFIQSNYSGFGSGIVVPGTGISLQNRASGFSLEEGHPNRVAGGKRPFHTIIPGFVTREGAPVMSFGVMGGPMQAQGHVQMMVRLADHGQNPQAASDAPRWQWIGGRGLALEHGIAPDVAEELERRGHKVEYRDFTSFGGAQLIHRLEGGGFLAASDSRKDGQAAGY